MAIARRFLPPWSVEERAGLLGCRALLRRETEPRAALQRRGYHTYFAARAIIATVTITNAAICSQKLLVIAFVCKLGIHGRSPPFKDERRDKGEKLAIAPLSCFFDFRHCHSA